MQQIEAQRAELRELNELNFSRFESRLNELSRVMDARFAQLEAKIEQRTADLMKRSFVGAVAALAGVLR